MDAQVQQKPKDPGAEGSRNLQDSILIPTPYTNEDDEGLGSYPFSKGLTPSLLLLGPLSGPRLPTKPDSLSLERHVKTCWKKISVITKSNLTICLEAREQQPPVETVMDKD